MDNLPNKSGLPNLQLLQTTDSQGSGFSENPSYLKIDSQKSYPK
jgi:hypothetical protein